MKVEIDKWREQAGLNYFVKPEGDPLKKAIDLSVDIDDLNLVEMDKAMLVLSNYHSYLSSQAGIIAARVFFLEDELNSRIDLKASRYAAPSAAERRAVAISKDEDARKLKERLAKEQTKQLMLRPIVDSIRLKIDALKKIYDRRGRSVA
jgi:hypothetical protein